jgi:octaprenyl-diphosphate synthase
MCVLAGDWLYMQAFKIAVQERNFRILDVLVELTQQLVEGELLQMEKLGRLISLSEYLDLIYRKTACLFSVCMRVGGILGGATEVQEDRLGQYGRDLGIAFQIVDDVLDLTASESVLGKPVASDLREGKATMAVIHALERCTPAERRQIETVLHDRAFNGVTHADILTILDSYGSLDFAHQQAARYAESARKAICIFPDSEFKRALLWAPEFVVVREK